MTESDSPIDPLPAPKAAPSADIDQRLHPLSWVFVLVTQLRSMALPLIALIVFGKGDRWIAWGLVGAVGVAVYALIYSLSFRYRIGKSELLVRSGILSRTERHVPFNRIQNIVQKRNLLHRLFGVTELRLESAGGSKPEAVMNVITLKAAQALEQTLRHQGKDGAESVTIDAPRVPWFALPFADLLRLGLVDNRGWVAVGAVFALFWQVGNDDWNPWRQFQGVATEWFGVWSHLLEGVGGRAFSILLLILVGLLAVKLLSLVMAIITFHDFRLSGDETRLSTESGLLTRHTASARRDKIQRLMLSESWLARRLGRRRLSCEVAAGGRTEGNSEQAAMRLRWLAPIATPEQVAQIVAQVMPGLDVDALQWQPLHPRAFGRMLRAGLFWWSLLLIPALWALGPLALLGALLVVAWSWLHARGWCRFAGYICDGEYIAFRAGWFLRQWTFARIDKAQSVSITHSPFDRRRHMQNLSVDTAGASSNGLALMIPYLGQEDARRIAEIVRRHLSIEPVSALPALNQ